VAGRLLHTPPPLVARGFTRLRRERLVWVDLAWLLLLFPSSPAVKITVTCNKSKTHKQQLILSFCFLFTICFLSLLLRFGSASLYRSVLFFSFPIVLCLRWRQDQGGRRLLGFGFPSGLCSCWWPVRVLAKTTTYRLLPFGWRGMSRSGWMAYGAAVLWLVPGPVEGDEGKNGVAGFSQAARWWWRRNDLVRDGKR